MSYGRPMADLVQRTDMTAGVDLIAALATPYSYSALAVIRLSGRDCILRIADHFSDPNPLVSSPGYTLHHGYLVDGKTS